MKRSTNVSKRSKMTARTGTERRVAGVRRIILGDNIDVLRTLADGSVDLIYIDPPFNTGRDQRRTRIRARRVERGGDRTGFGGRRYASERVASSGFADRFDDFLRFLEPRLREGHRVLAATGSFFLHVDPREVHYCKVLLDEIFGRDCFQNEIIWAYDYGGRSRRRWPAKHDNILWYTRDPQRFTFDYDAIDRIPYMAPGLVNAEKAARGKTPTDVWWHTIVPTNGREKTGYATQKPRGVLDRIVRVHSRPGDLLLDYFAGSGTLGESAAHLERDFILVDESPEAVKVMRERLAFAEPEYTEVYSSEGAPGKRSQGGSGRKRSPR